jgi:protein-tyrosine phosphatase
MRTELYWIEGPWNGRLAIMPRPRGGDWLEDEIRSWRQAGVDCVVSLLTADERSELELDGEGKACAKEGLEYLSFPITDRGTPASRTAMLEFVRPLERKLALGHGVAIHCRAGIGRSALLAACLLVAAGLDVAGAFQRISAARGCPVPDTIGQKEWVARLATSLLPAPTEN